MQADDSKSSKVSTIPRSKSSMSRDSTPNLGQGVASQSFDIGDCRQHFG